MQLTSFWVLISLSFSKVPTWVGVIIFHLLPFFFFGFTRKEKNSWKNIDFFFLVLMYNILWHLFLHDINSEIKIADVSTEAMRHVAVFESRPLSLSLLFFSVISIGFTQLHHRINMGNKCVLYSKDILSPFRCKISCFDQSYPIKICCDF